MQSILWNVGAQGHGFNNSLTVSSQFNSAPFASPVSTAASYASPVIKTSPTSTLDYMALKQIHTAGQVDQRADIYALDVMTYQPQLTFEQSEAIKRTMAKDPTERFAAASHFIEALAG